MPYLSLTISSRIEEKLKKLESLRPLPSAAVQKLKEQFEIEMTYNSNAIEGNSLTLKETYLVIHEGLAINGKPLKDHLEAKDHHDALTFLYDLIGNQTQSTISEHLIREIHSLVVKKTEEEFAGKYRTSNVFIGGDGYTPPDASQVPGEMKNLMTWFTNSKKKINLIELSALLHHKLVYIHPFFDGNGRTARLVMNITLMRAGYPLVVILKNDRKKYYRVLSQADKGIYEPLIGFVAQAIERSLDIYLKILTPINKKREKYQLLSEISSKTRYSTKYLNLLARKRKLEAHKQGRNWLTSVEAVDRYINSRDRKREIN